MMTPDDHEFYMAGLTAGVHLHWFYRHVPKFPNPVRGQFLPPADPYLLRDQYERHDSRAALFFLDRMEQWRANH